MGLTGFQHRGEGGDNAYGYWYMSPGAQGQLYTSVGQSQYGRPEVSGTTLGAPVGGQALSNREVSFVPLLASEVGKSLRLRVSGSMVAWNGDCSMLSLGHWLGTMAGMMMTVS